MRLTFKLLGLFAAVTLLVIAADGYLSIERERDLFMTDMRESARLVGEITAPLFSEVWRSQGRTRALNLLREINTSEARITVKWVSLSAADGLEAVPKIEPNTLRRWERDSDLVFSYETDGRPQMSMYIPVDENDPALGWLELTQPYDNLHEYTRESLTRTLALGLALAMLAGGTQVVFGTRIVGRPLRRLEEHARRIGQGDLSTCEIPRSRDELETLATAFNLMCLNLESAIREIKTQTENRVAALEQLRHSERLATVGQIASGLAHELGTPLNVISGRAKMIVDGDLTREESLHSSQVIVEQSGRMATIIRRLLDFARRHPTQYASASLAGVVGRAIELLRPIARKANVTIELTEALDLPLVRLDQTQVEHALINILVNGIHAMPQGGRMIVSLGIRSVHSDPVIGSLPPKQFAYVSIADNGVGIEPDVLSRIFDPFFTTKAPGAGTGLGLSIAKGVIEEHGGSIEVTSTVGLGTTVIVLVPLQETT